MNFSVIKKSFFVTLILFILNNIFPCYAMNKLLFSSNPQESTAIFHQVKKTPGSFPKFNGKVYCLKPTTKIGVNTDTICYAEHSLSKTQISDPEIISEIIFKTDNFYDIFILSDNNVPKKARQNLKSDLNKLLSVSFNITDQKIKDSNKLSSKDKQEIIDEYKKLRQVDVNDSNAIESGLANTINNLAEKSVHGVITKGLHQYVSSLDSDDVKIINKCLKLKGFKDEDNVFLTINHLVEQRLEKNFSFLTNEGDLDFYNAESPNSGAILKKQRIPKVIIQNKANKRVIPEPIHSIKNRIDNYQFGKTLKNPVNSLKKLSNKLDYFRLNYDPTKLKANLKNNASLKQFKFDYYRLKKSKQRSV